MRVPCRVAIATGLGLLIGGAFVGCGYDWDFVDADGGGSDASIATDATFTDAPFDALTSGEAGSGATCTTSADCNATNYCVFQDRLCGKGQKLGTCVSVSATAACGPFPNGMICGCGYSGNPGALYASACDAQNKRVDVNANPSACATGGYFQCEFAYCFRGPDFCLEYPEDGGFACDPFPKCDGAAGCACAKTAVSCANAVCLTDAGTTGLPGDIAIACP
jgi:hypothetical protein